MRAGVDPDRFQVGFVSDDAGLEHCGLAEAGVVAFEKVSPVRKFAAFKGQANYPGLYYAVTMGAHVGFESWLERDTAVALDFDVDVVGFASQPFWLMWSDEASRRRHAPDFFARRRDGSGLVVDCRPADRITDRDAIAFAATKLACQVVDWEYRLIGGFDRVWLTNLQWLAGYRQHRYRVDQHVKPLQEAFAKPRSLMEGAATVGDPIAVLPVLYHLLWAQELVVDLSVRLEGASEVSRCGGC